MAAHPGPADLISKSPGNRQFIYLFIYLNGGEWGGGKRNPPPTAHAGIPLPFRPSPLISPSSSISLHCSTLRRAKKRLLCLSWEKSPPPLGLPFGLLPPRGTGSRESTRGISPCRPVGRSVSPSVRPLGRLNQPSQAKPYLLHAATQTRGASLPPEALTSPGLSGAPAPSRTITGRRGRSSSVKGRASLVPETERG